MITIRAHHDMDGLCSGYFLSLVIPNSTVQIWDGQFGDTTGLKPGDYMVDMRPKQDMEGLTVYDHHGPYPDEHKYTLIYSEEPACWIVWNKHKDEIPRDKWWLLAAGVIGDGQPELIPYEVFKECPKLLTKVKTSAYKDKYTGKWKQNYFLLYKLLSSGINSLLRIHNLDAALELVKNAKSPEDIITNKLVKQAKAKVRAEYDAIMSSCQIYNFDNLLLYIYESNYRMAGYIATVQNQEESTTVLAINKTDGSGSLRGDLALYWREVLKDLGYLEIDGHPGFMGARLTDTPSVLVDALSKKFSFDRETIS